MAGNPNPSSALLLFFVVTTIYFIIKYNLAGKSAMMTTIAYVLAVIIGEFFINLELTNEMCGEKQWGTAFVITFAPWLIIFGLFIIMLDLFPGWKTPFSNTIGYGVALIGGVSAVVSSIFKDPKEVDAAGNKPMLQSVEYIYRDQSLLINEIGEGTEAFNNFWDTMKNAMKTGAHGDSVLKQQLQSLVNLKYLTSEYTWYLLTGALVTSISYNYLINVGCNNSAKNMLNRREAYNRKMKAKATEEDKDKKDAVVYTATE